MVKYIKENNEIKQMPVECIKGATLLSKDEAESFLTREERKCAYEGKSCFWWLRSPGSGGQDFAAGVRSDGSVFPYGYYVISDVGCVRPALILNLQSSNLKVGDVFEFGEYKFKVISSNLAICDVIIDACPFNENLRDGNSYEASDIKQRVEDWFNKTLKKKNEHIEDQREYKDNIIPSGEKTAREYQEGKPFGVNRQDQIDFILDFLYNNPKLRRYDWFIDLAVEIANEHKKKKEKQTKEKQEKTHWLFKLTQALMFDSNELDYYEEEKIINNVIEVEQLKTKEEAEKECKVIGDRFKKELNSETLYNDLFYMDTEEEVDLENNDWKEVGQLINKIIDYTETCENYYDFNSDDKRLLKKHMSKINKPLYRFAPQEFSGLSSNPSKGDILYMNRDDKDEYAFRSFTRDYSSSSMYDFVGYIVDYMDEDERLVVFQTVGPVYGIDIDVFSEFARLHSGNNQNEVLVGGVFKIVDVEETVIDYGYIYDIDALLVKIKQISH